MAKLHCIISMEKDLIVQGTKDSGFHGYKPSTPGNHDILLRGTMTSHSGYHNIMLGEPSE